MFLRLTRIEYNEAKEKIRNRDYRNHILDDPVERHMGLLEIVCSEDGPCCPETPGLKGETISTHLKRHDIELRQELNNYSSAFLTYPPKGENEKEQCYYFLISAPNKDYIYLFKLYDIESEKYKASSDDIKHKLADWETYKMDKPYGIIYDKNDMDASFRVVPIAELNNWNISYLTHDDFDSIWKMLIYNIYTNVFEKTDFLVASFYKWLDHLTNRYHHV